MTQEGKTWRYVREPGREGSWMTTSTFNVKNCITTEIKLWKDCKDCPVQSGFGILTNNTNDGFAYHNDITIVWKTPDTKDNQCDMKKILEGKANMTRTKDHGIVTTTCVGPQLATECPNGPIENTKWKYNETSLPNQRIPGDSHQSLRGSAPTACELRERQHTDQCHRRTGRSHLVQFSNDCTREE